MQHRHRCYTCKTAFSFTVGTILHHTHMPLQKRFLAVSLMLNPKKGLGQNEHTELKNKDVPLPLKFGDE